MNISLIKTITGHQQYGSIAEQDIYGVWHHPDIIDGLDDQLEDKDPPLLKSSDLMKSFHITHSKMGYSPLLPRVVNLKRILSRLNSAQLIKNQKSIWTEF